MAVGRCFRIFHKYVKDAPYSLILENSRNSEEFLLLESGVVATLRSDECEEFKKQYTKLSDGYGCLGILQLYGAAFPIQYLAIVSSCVSVGKIGECDIYRITGVQFLPMFAPLPPSGVSADERVTEIQKLVSSGTFYFAWSANESFIIDLSLCAQKRYQGSASDSRFFWNRTLHLPLQRYGVNTNGWLLRCMCGAVEIKTIYIGHKTAKACLVSRLSCERMGTRFNVRGVNDEGHVANFVETEQTLLKQLEALDVLSKPNIRGRFEEVYKQIWIQNGDQCSRIYAGTGALEGKSKIKDASRSVTRTIQNNLMDGSKQEAIDLFLLGTGLNSELCDRASSLLPVALLQASPNILSSIVDKLEDFTIPQTIRVFCGTWNVNGGQRFNSVAFRGQQALSDWLLELPEKSKFAQLVDMVHDFTVPTDIFAIGFEEIVDLNASNIMSASTTNQRLWAEELRKTLCRNHKYILITSVQLVGVCLFVFIRPHLTPFIKALSTDSVKTGLGGAAGNKGGVAGRTVFSHDFLFWLGDFNYRIDMSGEEVKQLVKQGNLAPLQQSDQLLAQKSGGNVFQGFFEGTLNFAPTYKYDTFSDDYDTSEKCRAPAWTDRVLWRQRANMGRDPLTEPGPECRLLFYGRAELKEVVGCMGPSDATVLVSVSGRSPGSGFPMERIDNVLAKVAELGIQVLLVKFVSDDMWLIFKDGEMALAALSMDGCSMDDGAKINVKLRSPRWEEDSRKELEECRWTATDDLSYTLLSEDTNPLDDTFYDEDDELENETITMSSAGQLSAARGESPGSGRSTPVRGEDKLKKEPPPRPSAPPKRPPPPQIKCSASTGNFPHVKRDHP